MGYDKNVMKNDRTDSFDQPATGFEPDPAVAPITCPACGRDVPSACESTCPACGDRFDRTQRLVDEHGPEAFIPNALPWRNDLTGPTMIIETGMVVSLGLLLLLLVYRFFGGWSWSAAMFAVGYWTCYALIRRRNARRTLRAILDAFRADIDDDEPQNAAP